MSPIGRSVLRIGDFVLSNKRLQLSPAKFSIGQLVLSRVGQSNRSFYWTPFSPRRSIDQSVFHCINLRTKLHCTSDTTSSGDHHSFDLPNYIERASHNEKQLANKLARHTGSQPNPLHALHPIICTLHAHLPPHNLSPRHWRTRLLHRPRHTLTKPQTKPPSNSLACRRRSIDIQQN